MQDCHLKQFIKNIHPIMLASFLFTDKKTFRAKTPKNPQGPTVCISINQEERRRDKTPVHVHTISVQSMTASVSKLQVVLH